MHRDSHNTRWRNASFRAYADYMETDDFARGIARLMDEAERQPTAYFCAEAVWWRCHRSLVSDYLKAHGWRVMHIPTHRPPAWSATESTSPTRVSLINE